MTFRFEKTLLAAHDARLAGRFRKALAFYTRAESLAETPVERLDALAGRGMTLRGLCRYREALRDFGRAALGYRRLGDKAGAAFINYSMGGAFRFLGKFRKAEPLLRAAVRAGKEPEDRAFTLMALAGMKRMTGDYPLSGKLYREALRLGEKMKNPYVMGYAHCGIGNAARMLGRRAEARRHLNKAVKLYRSIGDRVSQPYTLLAIGLLDLEEGKPASWSEASRYFRATGDRRGLIHLELCRTSERVASGSLDLARLKKNERASRKLGLKLEALHAEYLAKGATAALETRYANIGARIPASIYRLP